MGGAWQQRGEIQLRSMLRVEHDAIMDVELRAQDVPGGMEHIRKVHN